MQQSRAWCTMPQLPDQAPCHAVPCDQLSEQIHLLLLSASYYSCICLLVFPLGDFLPPLKELISTLTCPSAALATSVSCRLLLWAPPICSFYLSQCWKITSHHPSHQSLLRGSLDALLSFMVTQANMSSLQCLCYHDGQQSIDGSSQQRLVGRPRFCSMLKSAKLLPCQNLVVP